MAKQLETIATAHESLSALLHAIEPRVLIRIACASAGIVVGELVALRNRNPRIEISAQSRRALGAVIDLVYTVHAADDSVVESWVFEIELSFSWEKIWTWALYEIAVEVEYHATCNLAVFSPEPRMRERIRSRVLPRMRKTKPIMVERDQIERIIDYADARARPELTILGCLYHAHEPAALADQVEVFRAAWVALQSLERRLAQRYAVAVMSIVAPNIVEQGISELRERGELDEGRWELFSESERKGHSFHRGREEGRAEGREEGRVEGREEGRAEGRREQLRRSVVDVLELRGFTLSQAQRERIASCESVETLERWYEAGKTAAANQSVDQLLATV